MGAVMLGLLTKLGVPQWAAEVLLGATAVIALGSGGYYRGHHDRVVADELAVQKA